MKMTLTMLATLFAATALAVTPPLNTNRTEVLDFFAENVYGVRPDLSGFKKTCSVVDRGFVVDLAARRRDVTLNVMTPWGETNFTAVALLPTLSGGARVPCFVYVSFTSPSAMLAQPDNAELKPQRWPVKDILSRGFATVAFCYEDVFPDHQKSVKEWGGAKGRAPNGWGAISTWALAASRVMDWLETADGVDAAKVAVVGHSRLGKTALWTGATDTRFAYTVINNSGCMGARASTRNITDPEPVDYSRQSVVCGETIEFITRMFPHWFAPNCRAKYAGKDADLPFDQHWLVAALAPRLVAVGSSEDDHWACPSGEHAGLDLARPAWGKKLQNRCHYHIRPGGHGIKPEDWADYMDFAARHGWGK